MQKRTVSVEHHVDPNDLNLEIIVKKSQSPLCKLEKGEKLIKVFLGKCKVTGCLCSSPRLLEQQDGESLGGQTAELQTDLRFGGGQTHQCCGSSPAPSSAPPPLTMGAGSCAGLHTPLSTCHTFFLAALLGNFSHPLAPVPTTSNSSTQKQLLGGPDHTE